jgi:hypothetical protein
MTWGTILVLIFLGLIIDRLHKGYRDSSEDDD